MSSFSYFAQHIKLCPIFPFFSVENLTFVGCISRGKKTAPRSAGSWQLAYESSTWRCHTGAAGRICGSIGPKSGDNVEIPKMYGPINHL